MKKRKANSKTKPTRKAPRRPVRSRAKKTRARTDLSSIPIGDLSTIGPRNPNQFEDPGIGRSRAIKQIRVWDEKEPEYRFLALARAAARTRFQIARFVRINSKSRIIGLAAALDEYSRAAQRQLDQLGSTFRPHGFETRIVKWRGFAGWPSKIANAWANDGRERAALALVRLGVHEAANAIHPNELAPLDDDALLKHSAKVLRVLADRVKTVDQDVLEDLLQQELVALKAAELADFLPASHFKKQYQPMIWQAARPNRKRKRVRTKRIDGVVRYSVSDFKRHWPNKPL